MPIVSAARKHPIITALIIGTMLRFCLIPFFTYSFDSNSWALIIANGEAGGNLYDVYGYFYFPTWGYLLFAWGQLISFIPGTSNLGIILPQISYIESYGSYRPIVTSLAFNISFKILLTIFDIVASCVVGYVVEQFTKNKSNGIKAFALCYLCPAVISISAVSGFFDILAAMFTIICLVFLVDKKYFLTGITFSLSVLIKFFPMFIGFIIIAYILKTSDGWREKMINCTKSFFGCGTVILLFMFPQITHGQIGNALLFLTDRSGNMIHKLAEPHIIILMIAGTIAVMIALLLYSKIRPRFILLVDKISEGMKMPHTITLLVLSILIALMIMACAGFQRSLELILNNPVPTYCVVAIISFLVSLHIYHDEKNLDLGQLITICTLIIALTMIYMPNPQYLAVLIPLIIAIYSIYGGEHLKICLILLSIIVFIYPFDNLPFLLTSESAYMGLNIDWLSNLIRGFMEDRIMGLSYRDIWVSSNIFAVQLCVIISIWAIIEHYKNRYASTDNQRDTT